MSRKPAETAIALLAKGTPSTAVGRRARSLHIHARWQWPFAQQNAPGRVYLLRGFGEGIKA
jgi:hypothetical protein